MTDPRVDLDPLKRAVEAMRTQREAAQKESARLAAEREAERPATDGGTT